MNGHHLSRSVLLFCLLVAFVLPLVSTAQEKKDAPLITPSAQTNPPKPDGSPSQPPTTQQGSRTGDDQIVINTDLITFAVTVTDSYGRFVSGLNKSAFSVLDEKEPQEITFFSDEDAPVSVGIVMDLTGSMGGDKVRRAKDALSRFFETSHDQDEYFLVTLHSGRAYLTLDRTRDSKAVLDKLTFTETKGNTAFYDGVYLAAEKVQHGTHSKRALLVISDGQDNNSRYTFGDVRRLLKESDVVVYSIGILGGNDPGSSLGMEGQAILDEISAVSGGKAFFPNTGAEMDELFERIALELRHQYSIGYKPKNFTNDGKWHKIKVKVTPPRGLPRLFVRTRDGYFATTNPR